MEKYVEKKKSFISSAIDGLVKVENVSLVLLMTGMIILCFLQVLFRYVFEFSAPWTEELSRYMMVWLIFIGAAWATHAQNHIEIDVLELFFKNKVVRKSIELVTSLIILIFCVFFLYSAAVYLPQVVASNERTIALGIPMWIPQSCLLVGAILILIHSVEVFVRKLTDLLKGGR
ncbi:MAG: TRAP transporter small permease [Desulfotomaculaceae bacterium]